MAKKRFFKVNDDNLNPVRSKSEARERGKKGGVKSGEKRRKKKALRETLEALLNVPLKDPELLDKFKKLGFEKDMRMQDAISAAMIQQAAHGDVRAFVAISEAIAPREGETDDVAFAPKIVHIDAEQSEESIEELLNDG